MTKLLLPLLGPNQSILLELLEEESSENLFFKTTADFGPVESPSKISGMIDPTKIHIQKLPGLSIPKITEITYVISGDKIYGIGGILDEDLGIHRCHFLSHVYCNSVVAPELHCSPLPAMNIGRAKPLTAVLGGMLYVFGGLYKCTDNPFAEVFDPESRVWKPLPKLGSLCVGAYTATVAMVCESNEMIVLLSLREECLIVFSPRCNTWNLLDFIHPSVVNIWKYISMKPIMVGETIYYCIHRQLHAYNISRNEWLSTDISCLPTYDNDIRFSSLIHVGRLTFYLVWDNHQGIVHVTRFRACDKDTLTVDVVSQKHFYLEEDGDDVTFVDALMCGVAQD